MIRGRGKTFVYFIAPVIGGPIKIGCSEGPAHRLITLAAWAPYKLEILAQAPGTWEDEQTIHRLFADHWSHSEWFRPHHEIYELIAMVHRTGALPPSYRATADKPRGLPRGKRRGWSEEAKANARKTHQDRHSSIKASRAARPEILAFLERTGMTPTDLDKAVGSGWVVHHTVKSGDSCYGFEHIPKILDYIRAHQAAPESAVA